MKNTLRRIRVPFVAAALVATLTAPASAEPDWVLVGSGTGGVPGVGSVHVLGSLLGSAGRAACVPTTATNEVAAFTWKAWWSASTNEIAFDWHGTGRSRVTADCAKAVTTKVRVSDYAPGGEPPAVHGAIATDTSATPDNGEYAVVASATNWVTYYDNLYQRGPALVEVTVSGSYLDRFTSKQVPIACMAVYYRITPTPAGPIVDGPTASQACG